MRWGHVANQKPPRACGGCTEGVQRVVVGTCSQLKTSIVCPWLHMEGVYRVCRGHAEGMQRVVVGTCSQLKTSIVLSLVTHIEHVEGAQRACGGHAGGAWRVCRGCVEGAQRACRGLWWGYVAN